MGRVLITEEVAGDASAIPALATVTTAVGVVGVDPRCVATMFAFPTATVTFEDAGLETGTCADTLADAACVETETEGLLPPLAPAPTDTGGVAGTCGDCTGTEAPAFAPTC